MRTPIVTDLEALLQSRGNDITDWFIEQFRAAPAGIYSSVDLRHSGYKIVPVDTNLFPAGFNNLSDAARGRAAVSFKRFFQTQMPEAKNLLLVPEGHTRNLAYLENLRVLQYLLGEAGFAVRIGRLDGLDAPTELDTMDGGRITQEPVVRDGDRLTTADGFAVDAIVLNNDMTLGIPPLLQGITQPLAPNPEQGWHKRRKSHHFAAYQTVAEQFASRFGIDPWLISAYMHHSSALDFKQSQGLDALEEAVTKVLEQTAAKYREYTIDETPYAYIKADAGTYGMGIMTVTRPEEVREMNKKSRNKMDVVKEGAHNTEVLIQEGVPTIDRVGDAPAEPMIYLVNGQAVGGAYRTNAERDAYQNLNARGMTFNGMCDESERDDADRVRVENCNFKVFGLMARLATLAAARE